MMSGPIEVQRATGADLAEIVTLLTQADLPVKGITGAEGFLVQKQGGAVVGAVCTEDFGRDVLLRSLVVAPGTRAHGVGKALVQQVLEGARGAGRSRVHVLTLDGADYFAQFGFRPYPIDDAPQALRTSGEFGGCAAAGATAMALDLSSAADDPGLKEALQRKYADVALRAKAAGSSCCAPSSKNQVTSNLYSGQEEACLPTTAVDGSRGCGNPTALSALNPGETVLDLGSGAGADALLAALKVGPQGKVYGLDITDEMLEVARQGQDEIGIENVEFIKGENENIPLPARSVDVVISNCVISLAPDKDKVFREVARVLKPGGRMALSDIVSTAEVPQALRNDLTTWLGCLGGALEIETYRDKLERAGMTNIRIEITRVYDLAGLLAKDDNMSSALDGWSGQICAANVTATLRAASDRADGPLLAESLA
jgi:SAM-dependent methyltransferase/N-acetylglutamate synthase-like GNAT family acetyltransferase